MYIDDKIKSDIELLEKKKIDLINKLVKAIDEQDKLFHKDKTVMKDIDKCIKKYGNPRTIESELKSLDKILNDLKKDRKE
ncbi:hypothetical protein [Clostridium beijerinckii]|uniref:hypothetical protein n=1 Tax=Clostridium beijerinckii TaxID=1520 RepID=UPI001570781A|nr:hypothetical protein [Clostridium beijerinckii]NRU52651.1 hypothetical protein [Clostridium beijerinckii]NYC68694.1 hypothetical protein [Clostridium beijerinckii]NYC91843.1 hypothetical protein [Clostridium beijerinckii]